VIGGIYDIEQPGMHNYSAGSVRITSVQLLRPRDVGIRILNVTAYPLSQVGPTAYVDEGDLPKTCPEHFKPHPLTDVVVAPRSDSSWDVVIALTFDRPGTYTFGLLRIGYVSAGSRGWQDYYLENLHMTAVPGRSHPHLYQPDVCGPKAH